MSTLSPYRPNDVFADLRREMDDAFASWFGRSRLFGAPGTEAWFAPLDVHESDKEYTVRVDAPGLTEKDLKVSCNGDVLTISGERKNEKSESRGTMRYTERSFGSFSRSMRLPVHVAHDQIRARYQNGVLEVVVPKAPSAQQRDIKIEV
jgi:HSP20 family protein